MINNFYLVFLAELICFICVNGHNFEPLNLKDAKVLEFAKNLQTVGFHPKPQLACLNEQEEICFTYQPDQVVCRQTNVNTTDYLDVLRWDCTAIMSNYVEFDERTIECESYVNEDNEPVAPELVIKGSCYLRYNLRRVIEPKLTDYDRYLFVKAAGYCFFSLMFFIVCCIIAQKNKRTQRARFVSVYCVTNADNEFVIGYTANSTTNETRTTNNRNDPEEDLPPAYSTLFN